MILQADRAWADVVMQKRQSNAIVSQRTEVCPGLMVLRVVPDGWETPDFEPGQFAVLGLPNSAARCPDSDPEDEAADPEKVVARAYSIASSSKTREYLEFYINLVSSGDLTPRLFNLKIGDRLWLSPKISGLFTLADVPDGASVVMIATGTGLAPYMSMLRTHLTDEAGGRLAIIHGARHSCDLGYRDELASLDRVCPTLTYIPLISRPDKEPAPWSGLTGHVQDVWRNGELRETWGFHPKPDGTHVFLCGNPGMIESMEEIIKAEGFSEHTRKSPGQYHVERYW